MTVAPPASSCADHRSGDRTLGRTGHHRDLVGISTGSRIFSARRDPPEQRRVHRCARQPAPCPATSRPGWPPRHRHPRSAREPHPVGVDVTFVGEPHFDQILTGTGPAVVEHDGLARVERRRDQPRPVRAEFGGDQVDELGVTGRGRCGDRASQTELAEHHAGGRGQHTVAAGDLLGELAECGRVDARRRRPPPAEGIDTATPLRGGHRGDRRVDGLVDRGGVGQRTVMQPAELSAANAAALTGAQGDLGGDVLDPAVAEFPGLLDPFGDGGRPLARRAEHGAQLVVDRVGQHGAERLVRAGQLGDLRPQRRHVGLGGAVDGAQFEFRAEVDQQLVAP